MSARIGRVLVTGSSGTIGTRLCERLLSDGAQVVGADRRPNQWHSNIDGLTRRGDLCDGAFVETLPEGVDVVVHLAANARVHNLVLNPDLAFENMQMTYNVLEYCRRRRIRRLVFSSSREVYGNADGAYRREQEVDIRDCESAYTASKLSGEALAHAYQRCYGIDCVITRFSNVYGMYDDSDRVIPLFIRRTAKRQDLMVFGEDKILDFTFIDDTVSGVLRILHRFEQIKNNVFNIASGRGVSIVEVARMIIEQMGGDNRVRMEDNRVGEVVRFQADISKARRLLHYVPTTGIEEGIRRSILWYSGHLPEHRPVRPVREIAAWKPPAADETLVG